jgi:hypothetical protein
LGANNVLLPILGERVFPIHAATLGHSRGALLGMSLLMGARGAGALIGPLVGGRWAQHRESRLRTGILVSFLIGATGYVLLGTVSSFVLAVLCVALAHAGTSNNWVFSSTLLQIHTDDRFRGRVFSADYGLCMLTISASSYLAGVALDFGVTPSTFAIGLGLTLLVPAALWAVALRWMNGSTAPLRSRLR